MSSWHQFNAASIIAAKTGFGDSRMDFKVLYFKTLRLPELQGNQYVKIEIVLKVQTKGISNSVDDKVHLLSFDEFIPLKICS